MLRINGYLSSTVFLCLIFINPALGRADAAPDQKNDAVNQELDDISKEFRYMQPDSDEKAFNSMSEKASPKTMLKNILNPDLSEKPSPTTKPHMKTQVHTLDVGGEVSYYRNVAPVVPLVPANNTVREKYVGPMYGYYADYTYRPADPNFFNNFLTNVYFLQARYATSRYLTFSGEGDVKSKHDDAMEFRGLIGKDYFVGANARVTPYFGFGYRYLLDRGNGQVSNSSSLMEDRKSHYYYLPLGGIVALDMPRDWEVDLNAEYDILLSGYQKNFYSDWDQFSSPGTRYPDIVYHQDHGFGLRGSIKFLKKGPIVDFFVEPYFRFWNIDQSKSQSIVLNGTAYQVVEPKNNTTEIGSKFGIQF